MDSGLSLREQSNSTDRSAFTTRDSLEFLWSGLGLPGESLNCVSLSTIEEPSLPSSFKIGHLAQASITLSALLVSQVHGLRNGIPPPKVKVQQSHASIEYKSERLYTIDSKPPPSAWGPLSGIHKASDGYVRVHDAFSNHHSGTKALLGCAPDATREDVSSRIASWCSIDLETAAAEAGLVISALRSYQQWDVLAQAKAIADFPILIRKIGNAPKLSLSGRLGPKNDKCLRGLRVLEFSRVIAAPLAGKTLAAHGADVLWVTSPNLADSPGLDREFGRGKRTIRLDLDLEADITESLELADDADVFIQGYRPGSISSRGLSPEALLARRPADRGLIYANMSAYGPSGPWSTRRGFDSLVQTCTGMNVSEAEHFGAGEPARALPCQALDHASGYFLAAGITAALYAQIVEGGSWQVDVSLAGTMKYLRSLGQYHGREGFHVPDYTCAADVPATLKETAMSAFGEMSYIRHSASIEGVAVGWDVMPGRLGSDEKRWL
ncbi:CoA-transferase family III [Aspergillus unguis]